MKSENGNLINKSNVLEKIIYPMQLEISSNTNESLNNSIKNNIGEIVSTLSKISEYVNINFIDNSAIYMQGNCVANFIATPIIGYSWENNTTSSKIIKVVFSNVVNKNINSSNNDSIAPTNDTFIKEIVIDLKTNSSLNDEIEKLSLNLSDYKQFFLNNSQYSNVNISYISQSANIKNKTIKMLVSPNQGHNWKDNTIGSKIITVGLKNIKLSDEISNDSFLVNSKSDACVPMVDEWYEPIFIEKPLSISLKNEMIDYKPYFLNNIQKLKFFNKYKHVDISYAGCEEYVDDKVSYINISVKPKKGHLWEDGTNENKIIQIYLKKLYVADVVYNKEIDFSFPTYNVIKKSSMLTKFIDEIFKTDNLKEMYKKVLYDYPLYKIEYWIDGSKEILNNSSAQIIIGISPKLGHSWIDKTLDTKKLIIKVKNLYIPEWYPFMGKDA